MIFYWLVGILSMYEKIESTSINKGLKASIVISLLYFLILVIGYVFPKFIYFIIIKAIFKIQKLKISYLTYSLILGFIPISMSMYFTYFFNYSFEYINGRYFNSPITSVLNPIELSSLIIIIYLLKRRVEFSIRDSFVLFTGYIILFIFLNLMSEVLF